MTFRIPAFCELEMSFEEAKNTLTFHGDLLAGLKHVDDMWKATVSAPNTLAILSSMKTGSTKLMLTT